jgi:hypothetical protein
MWDDESQRLIAAEIRREKLLNPQPKPIAVWGWAVLWAVLILGIATAVGYELPGKNNGPHLASYVVGLIAAALLADIEGVLVFVVLAEVALAVWPTSPAPYASLVRVIELVVAAALLIGLITGVPRRYRPRAQLARLGREFWHRSWKTAPQRLYKPARLPSLRRHRWARLASLL